MLASIRCGLGGAGEKVSETQQVNILMVDDQPAKLLSYEAILVNLDANLIKARSGREGLELLLKHDVAVVLLDVSMPEINGFEMADMMRQHPRFQKTAILFISAVRMSDLDRIKGYESGAVDYISVPVVPEVLRAKVQVFVELHRKSRELERLNQELESRVEQRTRQLQESESLLRERADLLELASEAILVRDPAGVLKYWNAGAEVLYGWERSEVLGNPVHEILETQFPVEAKSSESILLEHGRWEGNLVQKTRDGQEVIVASRQVFKKEVGTILEINRDITSQLRAEEALRQTERLAAMGRVAGIIAHEINNPLEAITNAFYLLRNHPSLDEEARYYAQLGEVELARVGHITKQTLGFYRESQHPVNVPIAEILDDVLQLQSRLLLMNRITLDKKNFTDGEIRGFPVELRQVFLNLIGNAIQAMPNGGNLRIRMGTHRNETKGNTDLCISICDTGTGISPEHAKHLFEPFFTTKSTKGTGLGLWISKGIIQKYDGKIHFRSIKFQGSHMTSFRVILPGVTPALKAVEFTHHATGVETARASLGPAKHVHSCG
jgi:PAS domain S-box-containing protein